MPSGSERLRSEPRKPSKAQMRMTMALRTALMVLMALRVTIQRLKAAVKKRKPRKHRERLPRKAKVPRKEA